MPPRKIQGKERIKDEKKLEKKDIKVRFKTSEWHALKHAFTIDIA